MPLEGVRFLAVGTAYRQVEDSPKYAGWQLVSGY